MSRALEAVTDILGFDRVVNAGQASVLWGEVSHPESEVICYSEETLRRAAEENGCGWDWNLVYLFDLSLDDMAGRRMVLPKGCLKIYDRTVFVETGDRWRNEKSSLPAGYYLLNLRCDLRDKTPAEQSALVEGRSVWWERGDDRMVLQALVSSFLAHDRNLMKGLAHRGPRMTKRGGHIVVGNFENHLFFTEMSEKRNEDVGVCILRKHDGLPDWIK